MEDTNIKIETTLKDIGLWEQYQEIQAKQKLAQPEQGIAKSQTEAEKTLNVSGMDYGGIEMDTAKAPAITPPVGEAVAKITGDITSWTDIVKHLDTLDQRAQQRIQDYTQTMTDMAEKRMEARADQPSSEEIYRKTLEEFGLTPESKQKVQNLTGQLTSYNSQIATLEAQKQAALDRIEATPGRGLDLMSREQNEANKRYNREISAVAAQASIVSQQIQMERGLWDDARTMANQITQLATFDLQQELSDIEWVMGTYSEIFNVMSQSDKETWDKHYNLLKTGLDEKQSEIQMKNELMIRAAEQGIKLGLTLNDLKDKSLDEVVELYSDKVAAQPVATTYKAPTVKNFGTTATPDWRQFNTATGQWEQVSGVAGAIDTRRYIQDPNNPYASIPNPNYGKPIGTAEEEPEGIPAPPDYIDSFSQYRDAGWTREQVENSWISQYNEGKPIALVVKSKEDMYKKFPEIKSALDEVFGKEPGIVGKAWDFTKKQYQKGIDFWLDIWK